MRYTKENIELKMEKDNKRKLIFRVIIYIIIIPIILYNIYVIVYNSVNQDDSPGIFGLKTYVIASGSMQPTLNVGDAIIIKKCSQNELKPGDIITYKYGGTTITHRIEKTEKTPNGIEYITKGDNNDTEDQEPVKYEDVEGKFVQKLGYFGKVLTTMKSSIAIIILSVIFVMLYAHEIRINKMLRARNRKRKRYNWETGNR